MPAEWQTPGVAGCERDWGDAPKRGRDVSCCIQSPNSGLRGRLQRSRRSCARRPVTIRIGTGGGQPSRAPRCGHCVTPREYLCGAPSLGPLYLRRMTELAIGFDNVDAPLEGALPGCPSLALLPSSSSPSAEGHRDAVTPLWSSNKKPTIARIDWSPVPYGTP